MLQACGSGTNGPVNADVTLTAPSSELPFSTKEPDTFQAEFIRSVGGSESRSFFAKKGDKWRYDAYAGKTMSRSIISTDKVGYIDHASRSYAELPAGAFPEAAPDFVKDLTSGLLNQSAHSKFEEMSREGKVTVYRVLTEGLTGENNIYYDNDLGMIVKHEIKPADSGDSVVFELRNVKLEVGDQLFGIPSGFKKISWDEFKKLK